MADSAPLATIKRYYEGCSTANRELMLSTLAPDVVHYFVEDPPIHGADALASKWLEFFGDGRHAEWTVDAAVVEGDQAVIEWTMVYTRPAKSPPIFLIRGAEWYVFRDGLIAEIRAYELVAGEHPHELAGYPYAGRGYPVPPAGSIGLDPGSEAS
jgi:SnoaL-like domain